MMSIYVLRSDNLVKIGFSENLRSRVSSIIATVPVPVEFVGHMPGDREVEAHLHSLFADTLFSGEWFVETSEMRTMFETILIPSLPPPIQPERIARTLEKSSTADLSKRVREAAAEKWPNTTKPRIIEALAIDLGWSRSRTKDFYYADRRVALRAFELTAAEQWLAAVLKVVGFQDRA